MGSAALVGSAAALLCSKALGQRLTLHRCARGPESFERAYVFQDAGNTTFKMLRIMSPARERVAVFKIPVHALKRFPGAATRAGEYSFAQHCALLDPLPRHGAPGAMGELVKVPLGALIPEEGHRPLTASPWEGPPLAGA
eukprot:3755985-Alexandrium_andersonii.AAC.1